MNLVENKDWSWHDRDLEIRLSHNRSIIAFSEADRSKDRDQMRIKGIDATGSLIDEANELEEDSFDMILSRKGRKNKNGQPSLNLITMNPNNGWAKRRYYDKWKNGTLPTNVMVVEFTIEDSWQSQQDISALYRKAKWWVERYLKNNWNYADEDMSLITSYMWEKSQVYDLPESTTFNKYIGVDPKDTGNDEFIVSLVDDDILVAQKALNIPKLEFGLDKEVDERPISHLYANELVKFAQLHGFSAKDAKRISIEGNGIGTGVRDDMRKRGWYIDVYTATNQSRNEGYLALRDDMSNGDIRIFSSDEEDQKYDDNTLQRQLFAHSVDIVNQKETVCKKEVVKTEIGHSPDKADSFMIVNRIRRGLGRNDPKKRTSRIVF